MSIVHIQLGLFPGAAVVADMHLVSAHTRVLSDGTEAFVGEHLRWNAGKRRRSARRTTVSPPPPDQPSLFDPD